MTTGRSIRLRIGVVIASAAAVLLLAGFVQFAAISTRDIDNEPGRADAIAVLTGGEARIAEAGRLLAAGHGRRLLVSGVNPVTSPARVQALLGLPAETFHCCVDLDYVARDTIENAAETRAWLARWQFRSVILVTASYHMPRSLAELQRVAPNLRVLAHPVVPRQLQMDPWWLQPRSVRILSIEYLKLLPAAARLAATRLKRHADEQAAGIPASNSQDPVRPASSGTQASHSTIAH